MKIPTASSMKLKFPEFASVDDTTVEFSIEEAQLGVDDSWISDSHSTLGLMYLAAHYIMVAIARAESGTGSRIRSESMLGMSITYDTEDSQPDPGDFKTTPYGTRYLELLNMNVPGVLLL